MINIERTSRASFYFTHDRPSPISEEVLTQFNRVKAQKKLLLELNELHQNTEPHSVIELDEILNRIGKSGDNYLRRAFTKEPLSRFIKKIPFRSEQNQAHKWATCYSLDYKALSGNIPHQPEERVDTTKPNIVVKENEAAKGMGYSKSITATMPVTSAEVTKFLSFARSSEKTNDVQRVSPTDWVTIKTSNKRIVAVKDAVVILAAVYLTYAYHRYRLPYYNHNRISTPPNKTVLSISALRQALQKPRNVGTAMSIREALDVTRDTVYDFIGNITDITGETDTEEAASIRRRVFNCDAILNTLPNTDEEAKTAFYDANIFVIEWDDELFNSIINSKSLLALPQNLLTLDATLVVLYLKLRANKELKTKNSGDSEMTTGLNQFLHNYLGMETVEFLKVVQKAGKKHREGVEFHLDNPHEIKIELFGYLICVRAEANELYIKAIRHLVFQFAGVSPNHDAPTHWNELSAKLMSIIENDHEVNARQPERKLGVEINNGVVTVTDSETGNSCIITNLTSEKLISRFATLLQSQAQPQATLVSEFTKLQRDCTKPVIGEKAVRAIMADLIAYYRVEIDQSALMNLLVVYFSDKPEKAEQIERAVYLSLIIDDSILSDIVTYLTRRT
ncbi:replication initiator protein RctB domain-containing protein [Vibrio sp. TRT 29B02]|uniref:replication initiator protein RctB domain-containing protein n=1 Tax=Vibrio sp. TRT 29B02 TaxID=3418508 RepID=UPI003CEFEEAA